MTSAAATRSSSRRARGTSSSPGRPEPGCSACARRRTRTTTRSSPELAGEAVVGESVLLEPAGHELAGGEHVLGHQTPRLGRVVALDRGKDRLVLRDVRLEEARVLGEDHPGEVAREALVESGQRLPE